MQLYVAPRVSTCFARGSICSPRSGRMTIAQRFIAGTAMIAFFSPCNGRLNEMGLHEVVAVRSVVR
jgi:hypothetical protein